MSERILSGPCLACPYRRDVASGVWSADEYAKLVDYDRPTGSQPIATFACHAQPEALCHGWAVCHSNRGHEHELLALRLFAPGVPIPAAGVPLFASGTEAAAHGLKHLKRPGRKAKQTITNLLKKHARLRRDR